MKRAHFAAIATASLFAVTLYAGGLSKYKGWDKSPQGYLMTADERAQWATVRTDDDADKFVKDFLARRKPEFVTQVNTAAANADKYFTVGKVKGSTTERGRLIIILGPPGAISLSEKKLHGDMRMNVDSAMTVGASGGASVTDMANAANGAASSSGVTHVYTITYPADKLPAAYGKPITVEIEVDGGGGDSFADKKTQAELERLYEMVAESKLVPPAAK